MALPLAAVVRTPDDLGAWTVVDSRLRFRRVRLGLANPSGWVEVLEGFRPGEQVVLTPGRLADPSNEGRRLTTANVKPTTDSAK